MSEPTSPHPPQIQELLETFRRALSEVEGIPVDPVTASWKDIEMGVIKLLGGAFDPRQPSHGTIALMVGAALAAKLARVHGAFWFPNREAPGGAALGFREALVTVSPLAAATEALARSRLPLLDDVAKDIGEAIGRAKFGLGGGGAPAAKPGPGDYQALFDPGFVQLVALDERKAAAAWEGAPDALARDVEDALRRAPASLPQEAKQSLQQQIAGGLRRLEPGKPFAEQIDRAPRLAEVIALLQAQRAGTGFAPEELWSDVLIPLLHAGAPDALPPVGPDELEAYAQGLDPLLIYVDVVPYTTPVADEDGLLGVFPIDTISPLHEAFEQAGPTRLLKVDAAALRGPLASFDAARTRGAVERFSTALAQQASSAGGAASESTGGAGPEAPAAPPAEPSHLLDPALRLLSDLQTVVSALDDHTLLAVRRTTQMEAASAGALDLLRDALSGPRIVLA